MVNTILNLFAKLNPRRSLRARIGLTFFGMMLALGIVLGVLLINIATQEVRNPLRASTVILSLIASMLAVSTGWLVTDRIIRQLTQLAHYTHEIDEGQTKKTPVLTGNDELSQLSKSLYELVQDLETQRDILKISSDQLISAFNDGMQIQQALRDSEERFRLMVENVAEYAISVMDTDGRVVSWNLGAERMTGYKAEEIIGEHVSRFFPREALLLNKPFLQLEEAARVGKHEDESWRVRKDGSRFWANVITTALRDESGTLRGYAKVIRDMTERKQAEIKLQQLNADLEQRVFERTADLQERNEDLNAFAHTVAHDLKHPIQVVLGYAGMLQDDFEVLSLEERRLFLNEVMDAGKRMVSIINELLLLAQLRQAEVQKQPVTMATVITDAQKRLGPMIQEHNAQIVLPNDWPTALGYAPWLEEVWANYISNGLKYGGKPPCLVLGSDTLPNNRVRFWIRDNGNGLTQEQQSQLFNQFTRFNALRIEGHGVGLSVVKRIVEKLGGQVGVESEVGKGSTFFFTLPKA